MVPVLTRETAAENGEGHVTPTSQPRASVFPEGAGKMAAAAAAETGAGRDAMAEGLVELLKPAINQLDTHVHSVR